MTISHASHSPIPQHPRDEAPIRVFHYQRKRVIAYLVLLAGLFAFGVTRIVGPDGGVTEGGSGSLIAGLFVMGIAGFVFVDLLHKLRRKGPALVIERDGLRDLRDGDTFLPWPEIIAASIKRRMLARTVKIENSRGHAMEIDMNLLDGTAPELLDLISREARRAEAADDETADR